MLILCVKIITVLVAEVELVVSLGLFVYEIISANKGSCHPNLAVIMAQRKNVHTHSCIWTRSPQPLVMPGDIVEALVGGT